MIPRCSLVLALALAPAAAQRPGQDVEAIFYRAYWFDRGDRHAGEALAGYRRFLEVAPGHRLAAEAARFAFNLLRQSRREAETAAFAKRYAALLAGSAKPGINASFLDPNLDVDRMRARFEGESREIYRHRKLLAGLVGLRPGQAVADVGAGTGFFTWLFARAVGRRGRVYAVELAPRFVDHLDEVARRDGLPQVHVVQCSERSVGLAPGSIDVAFICDTYHHFEFPRATMASIHRALRPGGLVVVIDFERIPGKSRPWLLGHVRAGKKVVTKEVEAAGFRLAGEEKTPLAENYFLRFVKR